MALKKEAFAGVLQRWWLGEVSSELFKLSLQGSDAQALEVCLLSGLCSVTMPVDLREYMIILDI